MKFKKFFRLTEGFGRPSNIYSLFFRDITKLPNVERVVDDHGLSDGHVFLVRGTDGNAYEIQIRPARYAEYIKPQKKQKERRDEVDGV